MLFKNNSIYILDELDILNPCHVDLKTKEEAKTNKNAIKVMEIFINILWLQHQPRM